MHGRLDLDRFFDRHKTTTIFFLHRVKMIKIMMSRLPQNDGNLIMITTGMDTLLQDYHNAYEQFYAFLPKYGATFQEALIYANQEDLIPDPVKPYLRPNQEIHAPNNRVLELLSKNREDLLTLIGIVSQTHPEETNLKFCLINLRRFLDKFHVHQWTPEYIIIILETIQTGIKNYGTEEFFKELDLCL